MENRRKIGDVNASLQDTLAGIRVVQSFANEEIERKNSEKATTVFLSLNVRTIIVWEVLWVGICSSRV